MEQGAQVIGFKPDCSASLVGGENEQVKFQKLADKIWGAKPAPKGKNIYGNGIVFWGLSAREYLLSQDIPTDFAVREKSSKTDFDYIHYTVGNSDVYFVTNQTTSRKKIKAQFRVTGKQPELWNALTGEIREASAFTQSEGTTIVPIIIEPYGSIIVVFDKQISSNQKGENQRNYSESKIEQYIEGSWEVSFDPNWGGPGTITFPNLIDWTQHSNPGIKYYSGTAIYNKTFNVDYELLDNKEYYVRLGSVKDIGIAKITINGIEKGIVWTPPFRVNISQELREGENKLEIEVVNSWYNRVAGDQIFPDKKQYTSTNIRLNYDFRGRPTKTIPLEPSGLLAPVTIECADK